MAGLLGVDCADFGAHGVCVSLQMRTQTSGHQGDGGGRATAALRLAPNLRIGAAIDIAPIASAPAGLTQADQNPSFAAFAAYGAANGLGLSARISGALRNGAATISRDPGLGAEFGHGRAGLRAYGVAGEIGWGFAMRDGLVLTPFVGLRHLRATRGAYVEQLNAATSYPIMLDALSERSLTGSAGLRMRAQLTSGFALSASASAEYDFARASGALTGWSAIPGIERFALPSSGQGARLRAAGGLGAEYAWTPLQKFVVSMTAGGIAYSNRAFISTRAGYQISF
jgi:hypothetical protein